MGGVSITEGIGILKTAFDIAKGLKDVADTARRNAAIIELQEKILAAQAAQSNLVEYIRSLEEQVTRFETWDTERERRSTQRTRASNLSHML